MSARPEPTGARSSLGRVLFLIAILVLWHEASDRISDALGIETESFASPWKWPLIFVGTLVQYGGILWLGTIVWGKTSLRDLGWRFSRPLRLIAIGLLETAAICGLIVGAYGLMAGLDGIRGLGDAIVSLTPAQRLFFTVSGIKIAIFEESLFRGDLMRALEQRIGVFGAIVVSSAVFSLHHRTLEPVPLVMKFLMGLIFALGMARTRSLLPSALAHALVWAIIANN